MRLTTLAVVAAVAATVAAGHAGAPPTTRLRAFQSEEELRTFLRSFAERQRQSQRVRIGGITAPGPYAPAQAGIAGAAMAAADSVTNVQHAGVDEGGIVKMRGEHLIVLRRGRLFTISVGQHDLTPVSVVDAYGPDIDPRGTWYDELLVSGDKVVVVGYSYARGGTELGVFDLDAAGHLRHRSTHHLRSNDYYSSRNYSSRLIGTKLVLYTPFRLPLDGDPARSFPALRKWRGSRGNEEFRRIVPATRVYRPARPLDPRDALTLHTVTTCDLAAVELECEATSVLGPAGRVFYVSLQSVYVWTTEPSRAAEAVRPRSMAYALPLDGSAPGALQVEGSPIDQFSFLESEDGHLNVLLRSAARGDGMWSAERSRGRVALLRTPLSSFSDGSVPVPDWRYRWLPTPDSGALHNRFVGDHVLYGTGSGWGRPRPEAASRVVVAPWKGGEVASLALPHGVDRIEPLVLDATVIGTDGRNLHFTTLRLGRSPAIGSRHVRQNAAQGELRSHGFFYLPEREGRGVLGLPIRRAAAAGFEHLFRTSAAVVFLRNDDLRLQDIGELDAETNHVVDDACQASCVDWYGNARPLFVKGRIFALLGYELVEGQIVDGRLNETRRVNFAPTRRGTM